MTHILSFAIHAVLVSMLNAYDLIALLPGNAGTALRKHGDSVNLKQLSVSVRKCKADEITACFLKSLHIQSYDGLSSQEILARNLCNWTKSGFPKHEKST